MEPTPSFTSEPDNLNELFTLAKPELEAIDPSAFAPRFVSRERVLELSAILLQSFAPLAERIEKVVAEDDVPLRKAELERLDRRAWIYYAADLAANQPSSDVTKKLRRALRRRVAGHDRFLTRWVHAMFGDDPAYAEILADISRGTGSRDDAEDVIRLVDILRSNWPDIAGSKKLTKEHLDIAEADAGKQLNLLRKTSGNPARKLAAAAYAMWFADYTELMELGRYMTRGEPDRKLRFPGVREAGSSGSKGGATAEAVEELDELDGLDDEDEDELDDEEQDEFDDEELDDELEQEPEQLADA